MYNVQTISHSLAWMLNMSINFFFPTKWIFHQETAKCNIFQNPSNYLGSIILKNIFIWNKTTPYYTIINTGTTNEILSPWDNSPFSSLWSIIPGCRERGHSKNHKAKASWSSSAPAWNQQAHRLPCVLPGNWLLKAWKMYGKNTSKYGTIWKIWKTYGKTEFGLGRCLFMKCELNVWTHSNEMFTLVKRFIFCWSHYKR